MFQGSGGECVEEAGAFPQTLQGTAGICGGQRATRALALRAALAVAQDCGADVCALYAPRRGRAGIAFARQMAMYLAHVAFGLPLTGVGEAFGRDRTTVAHACMVIEERRDDPAFDHRMHALEQMLLRAAAEAGR